MNKKEGGTALVLVLLVVAMVTTLGITSVDRIHYSIKESSDISFKQQSFWYALGLESKASSFIQEMNRERNLSAVMISDEEIPTILVEIEGGQIEGSIKDLTTCFNLNGLVYVSGDNQLIVNQAGIDRFRNLLRVLRVEDLRQDKLIYSLVDWIDSNDFTEDVSGAEDDFYTRLESPYQSANQYIFHVNELINIKNYDAETLDLLLPYICALPQTGTNFINVNAIKKSQPEILVMLFGESLSLVSAANILSDRPISGFVDREEFLSHPELSNISLSNSAINSIKFNSDFYQLTVKVKNFEYPFVLNSYLQVLDSGRVRVVKRSQGVF